MIANKGDKVVCIKNDGCGCITISEIYEVLDTYGVGKIYGVLGTYRDGGKLYLVRNDIGKENYYPVERFISLSEWREQQINKIL